MRMLSIVIFAGMALGLALSAAACGGGGGGGSAKTNAPAAQSEIGVLLTEYSVKPEIASVQAGNVKFAARNIGGTAHELVVIKTDLGPEALPTKVDGSVDESAAGITIVGKTDSMEPQTAKNVAKDLSAGSYVLVCNLVQTVNGQTVSHYDRGMRAAFTVR